MRRIAAAGAVCLVSVIVAGSARQAQQPPLPKFRADIKLVVVDVSVLDGNRVPVRGLTAADFTILEDGRPQPVSTFSAIDVPDVEAPTATWMKEVAPDVQRNDDQADRRLMVVVLDDATPMPAADVLQVRTMARRVIDRLGPGDLAAVVYVLNKKKGQEFTSNRARLLAALDHFNGGVAGPFAGWDGFSATVLTMYRSTIGTLQGVTDSLIDLPGRRKALVFVSVGLPLDVEAVAPAEMGEGTSYAGDAARDLIKEVFDLFRAAQRANVNIYSLDPGGLRVGPSGENVGKLNREFLQAVSENTGGLAIINTNDPEPGIVQIFRENRSYYLLGYEAPNLQSVGKYRRIDIRVNRPGMTVRARRGYFEPRPAAPPKPGAKPVEPPSPIFTAMASVVPKTDVALRATAAPFAVPGQDKVALAVVLELELSVPETAARVADNLDVQINAYDAAGKLGGSDGAKVRFALKPGMDGSVKYEVLSRLDLKPGTYQLRLAASSSLQAKTGTVHYDVDVPDFSKGGLSLSGAVLSATAASASGPKDKLASILPVVPTTRREFWSDEEVTSFVRAYQGGKEPLAPVVVTARILDGRGAEVFKASESIDPSRFSANRAADYQLKLPLAVLVEGPYLLTIEAAFGRTPDGPGRDASNRTVSRDLRFVVR